MATLISNSRSFPVSDDGLKQAIDFLSGQVAGYGQNDAREIMVTVELTNRGNKRVGALDGQSIYDFEVAASPCKLWADEATKSVFRFDDEVFIWNGRQIYLTVGEKLAMFRILAKGEYPPPGLLVPVRATIRRLRARFGKEFPGLPRR